MPPDQPPPKQPPAKPPLQIRANSLSWLPFVIPILYLGFVFWLQPPDRLGDPLVAPWLGRLLYDDYDWTAIALRGLNARAGRSPGRSDDPCDDPLNKEPLHESLKQRRPLRSRYFLEYPYAAVWLFELGQDVSGLPNAGTSPAILDACHNRIVQFEPGSPAERSLWQGFRRTIRVYEVMAIASLLGLMLVVRLGYQRDWNTGRFGYLVLPAVLYFTLNRFDIWPALLTAGSLACLGRERFAASGILLGTAAMVKVFPILLAPFVFAYLWRRGRGVRAWSIALAATVLVLFLPPLLRYGWQATWAPYQYQLTRPLEGYTLYGFVLPNAMGQPGPPWNLIRLAILGITTAVLLVRPPSSLIGVLRRGAIALIVFLSLQLFYSPQWIVWLVPLLVPLAGAQRFVGPLLIVLDAITYLTFPVVYDRVGPLATYDGLHYWMMASLICARGAVFALLVAVLAWGEIADRFRLHSSPPAEFQEES